MGTTRSWYVSMRTLLLGKWGPEEWCYEESCSQLVVQKFAATAMQERLAQHNMGTHQWKVTMGTLKAATLAM